MQTICVQCVHHVNLEPNSPRRDVWYNQLCRAHTLLTEIDPVTGRGGYIAHNDLGDKYYQKEPWDYCRKHNHGNCPEFEGANHTQQEMLDALSGNGKE